MRLCLMMRRRYRGVRILFLVFVFSLMFICLMFPMAIWNSYPSDLVTDEETHLVRNLLATNETDDGQLYPPDAFTLEQRKNGAVVLYILGMLYMFVALAIICDEFFVPSLAVIIDRLDISEDVAGATFMAAGGSAPELFTSIIGVFLAKNNVGIGTIVGSAVFNILFVIGMCAIVSKTVLALTWWPLFRDVTFYSIDLVMLIVFFQDEIIYWYEALVLFLLYFLYVLFMKFNVQIEVWVKTKLLRRKGRIHSSDNLLNQANGKKPCCEGAHRAERRCSMPILHSGTNKFRHGVLQLMIHTIDPISESVVHDKAMRLHAVASVNNMEPLVEEDGTENNITNGNTQYGIMAVTAISNGHMTNGNNTSPTKSPESPRLNSIMKESPSQDSTPQGSSSQTPSNTMEDLPEDGDEPLDMSWPSSWPKRISYVLLAPLMFPMWLFLPDTRRPEKKKYYMVTFFGSIVGIMVFSYFMVWWANQTGETIGIPNEVMGLTILAAGTSIPDLITSVIVAKKGFGDMAVSSSVGSNIFDITVGLPFPWLLYAAIYDGASISVDSNGLECSIILLFGMLLAVIITVAVSKWNMTKTMGVAMIVLYCVFLVFSVLLELQIIGCPVG